MAASPVLPKLVGTRVKRREDPRLIQGKATYVDDVKLVGMLHVAFKRSDVAHGQITNVDTSAAAGMPGVEAVYTGAQIAEFVGPMPIGTPFPSPDHHPVAVDTVRYVGEPVAVVVATDRYLARDAADAVVVDYKMLPAVVDPEKAMTGEPAQIHADFENNLAGDSRPSGTGVSACQCVVGKLRLSALTGPSPVSEEWRLRCPYRPTPTRWWRGRGSGCSSDRRDGPRGGRRCRPPGG